MKIMCCFQTPTELCVCSPEDITVTDKHTGEATDTVKVFKSMEYHFHNYNMYCIFGMQ